MGMLKLFEQRCFVHCVQRPLPKEYLFQYHLFNLGRLLPSRVPRPNASNAIKPTTAIVTCRNPQRVAVPAVCEIHKAFCTSVKLANDAVLLHDCCNAQGWQRGRLTSHGADGHMGGVL
jgi:hypothetical protein